MKDMIDALGALRQTGPQAPADAETVAADVARAHRGLVHRRRRRWVVGSGAAAVTAIAVGAAVVVGVSGHAPAAPVHQQAAQVQQQVQLAAYTGNQPAGFVVQTVPVGWKVVSSNQYAFEVVPPTVSTADPRKINFMSGITVMLQGDSTFPSGSRLTPVTVNGRPGQLGYPEGNIAQWLVFSDAKGNKVMVQVPVNLGLTTDQIVRFADGITVTGDAQAPRG
jgi:hypothetical protein